MWNKRQIARFFRCSLTTVNNWQLQQCDGVCYHPQGIHVGMLMVWGLSHSDQRLRDRFDEALLRYFALIYIKSLFADKDAYVEVFIANGLDPESAEQTYRDILKLAGSRVEDVLDAPADSLMFLAKVQPSG